MADFNSTDYYKAYDPANPTTDRFDYDAFNKRMETITGQVGQPIVGDKVKIPELSGPERRYGYRGTTGLTEGEARAREITAPSWSPYRFYAEKESGYQERVDEYKTVQSQIDAAEKAYEVQKKSVAGQATKAAMSLGIQSQSTAIGMEKLGQLDAEIRGREIASASTWDEAIEKADEYVKTSRGRAAASLRVLDELNDEMGLTRNFAKAHDMQVAVQSTLGTLNSEGRQTAERYGVDSKEYQEFSAKKSQSLAVVQSNLHANYNKIQEAQDLSMLNATQESMYRHDMYVNFAEQTHVETLKAMAQNSQAYGLQVSAGLISLEQMRASGMENIANLIVSTPEFTVDMQPLVTLISEISQTHRGRMKEFKETY